MDRGRGRAGPAALAADANPCSCCRPARRHAPQRSAGNGACRSKKRRRRPGLSPHLWDEDQAVVCGSDERQGWALLGQRPHAAARRAGNAGTAVERRRLQGEAHALGRGGAACRRLPGQGQGAAQVVAAAVGSAGGSRARDSAAPADRLTAPITAAPLSHPMPPGGAPGHPRACEAEKSDRRGLRGGKGFRMLAARMPVALLGSLNSP